MNILSITFLNLLGPKYSYEEANWQSPIWQSYQNVLTSDQYHYLLDKSIFLKILKTYQNMSHYRKYYGFGWLMSK